MSKVCFSTGNHPYYHEDNGDYDQEDYEYDPDIICADYLEPEVQIENVEDDDENNEVEFWISERMSCQESAIIFLNKK